MQETAPRSTARKVSLVLLIVLLLGQALVVLATIVVSVSATVPPVKLRSCSAAAAPLLDVVP
jgi:hypothetical protein